MPITEALPTSIGASFALLEAEARKLVEQGNSVEDIAAWIDEPVEFVRNCLDPSFDPGSWYCWSKGGWERRVLMLIEEVPTPAEIAQRAEIEYKAALEADPGDRRQISVAQVVDAMRVVDGDIDAAATSLGCHVSTVYRRLFELPDWCCGSEDFEPADTDLTAI